MPIKMGDKTYKDFYAAMRAVMRKKGWGKDRAKRYVGKIKHMQED